MGLRNLHRCAIVLQPVQLLEPELQLEPEQPGLEEGSLQERPQVQEEQLERLPEQAQVQLLAQLVQK
jgi:hypothetical protein